MNWRPMIARLCLEAGILQEGKLVNAWTMADRLEVSVKTVYRDMEFVMDRLGWPVESSPRGYKLTGPLCLCAACSRRV